MCPTAAIFVPSDDMVKPDQPFWVGIIVESVVPSGTVLQTIPSLESFMVVGAIVATMRSFASEICKSVTEVGLGAVKVSDQLTPESMVI